jgi:hypothetical protein
MGGVCVQQPDLTLQSVVTPPGLIIYHNRTASSHLLSAGIHKVHMEGKPQKLRWRSSGLLLLIPFSWFFS